MAAQTVGDMSLADLERFIKSVLRNSQANLPLSLTLQNVTVTKKLTVEDQLQLSPQAIAYLHQVMGV